ncbi:MAG: prolipoprotein diacylglyceryl transferase [Eubacteriales bacterium]|nr:prolipoprotein diacylglyceryl transferase [Eubacteriales bacterium]
MLRISTISFPGLGIGEFNLDSVAFKVGSLTVAWYGIILTLGIIGAIAYLVYRRKYCNMSLDDIIDFALVVVPMGILGGRLYYVLTSLEKYHSFYDVIAIWNGGLAIYGAIIGGATGVILMCYIKKRNFFAIADCICPGVLIGQILGRWGNFFNGEAFGYETDIFCRMGVRNSLTYGQTMYVHPTFLYESLWNLLGLVLINLFFKHKKYNGQIFFMCFAWYGFGRMFIEGLRADSLYIFGSIRISQLVGGICFVVFGGLLLYNLIREKMKNKKSDC